MILEVPIHLSLDPNDFSAIKKVIGEMNCCIYISFK